MLDKPGYVVLVEAPNVMEAEFIAGALKTEGIDTHTDADHLADEFAMSQKMMGLQRVRVMVPRDQLGDAQRVLETLREARAEQGEEIPWDQPDGEGDDEPQPPPVPNRGVYFFWIVLFAGAAIAFAFLYWQERSLNEDRGGSDPIFTWRMEDGEYVTRRHRDDSIASVQLDRDGNGYFEYVEYFAPDGRPTGVFLDDDQNGVFEKHWGYAKGHGKEHAYIAYDLDQDEHAEVVGYRSKDGKFWRWHDANDDGYYEIRELVEVESGKVLMRHEDVGEEGFKRTK